MSAVVQMLRSGKKALRCAPSSNEWAMKMLPAAGRRHFGEFAERAVYGENGISPDILKAEQVSVMDEEERTAMMAHHYRALIALLGEDPDRDGVWKTPQRAAKALKYLTKGYEENVDSVLNGAVFDDEHDEMIVVRNIDFCSLCEHHLIPFRGHVHIAYIPDGRTVGLSKFARIVELYGRRLQDQERLTRNIVDGVNRVLRPKGVAAVVEAEHMCMTLRGVKKDRATTITSKMSGEFKENDRVRHEFLSTIDLSFK